MTQTTCRCYNKCYMDFGGFAMKCSDIIKEIRSQLNVSQEDLARELKISFATVNRWENGKSLPSKMAKRLLIDFCKEKKISADICSRVMQL